MRLRTLQLLIIVGKESNTDIPGNNIKRFSINYKTFREVVYRFKDHYYSR